MKIKKIKIENFKGITSLEIAPSDRFTISAKNGAGKTTIADAFYWLFTGKDSKLVDNPRVVPIGATECQPTVEVEAEINGKTVTIRKVQKYKIKDDKESSTNSYLINEVPMTERDFTAKLIELGVDMNKFLVLSHPDYLLRDMSKKNRDYIRNEILFPMADSKTDKEIADISKLAELSVLLNDYKLNEIEAMQKATLRKINDEIGKDNVVANARIDELMKSKSNVDKATIEKEITSIKAKIENNHSEQEKLKKEKEDINLEILNLTFERNGLSSKLTEEYHNKVRDLKDEIAEVKDNIRKLDNEADDLLLQKKVKEETVTANQDRINYLEERIETLNMSVLDESETICPTCGRTYGNGQINAIKEQFEKKKESGINSCCEEMRELQAVIAHTKDDISKIDEKYNGVHADVLRLANNVLAELEKELSEVKKPDVENSEEYRTLQTKIENLTLGVKKIDCSNLIQIENNLNGQLSELKSQLTLANNDIKIDESIAKIRENIKQAEINRANTEKVIYQIEQLNKNKNELLEESVNKHFDLVKWKLFKTLKNGSYEDACIPMIDGYELGTSANKGREILAKLDIISGLSNFYQQNLPILLDNAESLSSETEQRIKIDNQMIMFKVSEDEVLSFKED